MDQQLDVDTFLETSLLEYYKTGIHSYTSFDFCFK